MTDPAQRDPFDTIPPPGLPVPADDAARRAQSAVLLQDRRRFVLGSLAALTTLTARPGAAAAECATEPGVDGWEAASTDPDVELVPRATFTSMADSTAEDWVRIEAGLRTQQQAVPRTIVALLRSLEGVYAGFGVDQLTHVTQTATRAYRANAADELVLISLVHDVGKLVSNRNHPEIAAALVRPYVADGPYRILRHHMEFQWKHYGAQIGRSTTMRDRYTDFDWYDDATAFSDEWDQKAFDPDYDTKPLGDFEPLVHDIFGRFPETAAPTADDCL